MSYAIHRNMYNLQLGRFDGEGEYGIPEIKGVTVEEYESAGKLEYVPFNVCSGIQDGSGKAVHFYLDDYRFERAWTRPEKYAGILGRFDFVLSPDYSLYSDFSKALQVYNHYRKHWLAAYWESKGIRVIPTIAWSDEDSFEWCFEGEPEGGVVSASAIGCNNRRTRAAFNRGYAEMCKRLSPKLVILFGGNILTEANKRAVMCERRDGYADGRWETSREDAKWEDVAVVVV